MRAKVSITNNYSPEDIRQYDYSSFKDDKHSLEAILAIDFLDWLDNVNREEYIVIELIEDEDG